MRERGEDERIIHQGLPLTPVSISEADIYSVFPLVQGLEQNIIANFLSP